MSSLSKSTASDAMGTMAWTLRASGASVDEGRAWAHSPLELSYTTMSDSSCPVKPPCKYNLLPWYVMAAPPRGVMGGVGKVDQAQVVSENLCMSLRRP